MRKNISISAEMEKRANRIIARRGFDGFSDLIATLIREESEKPSTYPAHTEQSSPIHEAPSSPVEEAAGRVMKTLEAAKEELPKKGGSSTSRAAVGRGKKGPRR